MGRVQTLEKAKKEFADAEAVYPWDLRTVDVAP
jgi:hypothetical protein